MDDVEETQNSQGEQNSTLAEGHSNTDASDAMIAKKNLTQRVAERLLELSQNIELRKFPFSDMLTGENQRFQLELAQCMMRILVSGRYADALVVRVIICVLSCPNQSELKVGFADLKNVPSGSDLCHC